jgi:hypothetical protein
MRPTTITLSPISLLFTGSLALSAETVPTQPVPWHPCAKIAAACTQAGFFPNGAKTGVGIEVDYIRPIMASTPRRAQATRRCPKLILRSYRRAESEIRNSVWTAALSWRFRYGHDDEDYRSCCFGPQNTDS